MASITPMNGGVPEVIGPPHQKKRKVWVVFSNREGARGDCGLAFHGVYSSPEKAQEAMTEAGPFIDAWTEAATVDEYAYVS